MPPAVTVTETAAVGTFLDSRDVRDLSHVRRLLLQGLFSVSGDEHGTKDYPVPEVTLHALRGWMAAAGVSLKGEQRRLMLMALLQLEDEDDEKRLVQGHPILPAVLLK